MRGVIWLAAVAAVATGCGSAAKPAPPPVVHNAAHGDAASACLDVAADAERRGPGAKPVRATSMIDLDGDGTPDPAFTGFCSMMGGNCDTYLYGSNHGCPRYLGTVEVTEVSSGVSCAEPPRADTPCKLSASRMMIHGEIYEYFYAYGPDGYVEAGVGHQGDPPP